MFFFFLTLRIFPFGWRLFADTEINLNPIRNTRLQLQASRSTFRLKGEHQWQSLILDVSQNRSVGRIGQCFFLTLCVLSIFIVNPLHSSGCADRCLITHTNNIFSVILFLFQPYGSRYHISKTGYILMIDCT